MRFLVFMSIVLTLASGCGSRSRRPPKPPVPAPGAGTPADEVWSIAQVGDIHAPAFTHASIASNLVPFILAHTNDGTFNIKCFISTGDIYEQDYTVTNSLGLGWPMDSMLSDFERMRSNGIMVVLANGNHDCDYTNWPGAPSCWALRYNGTNLTWNSVFPLSFFSNQRGFIDTKEPGDSRNLIMSYTNGVKLLFLSYNSLANSCDPTNDYFPQTQWMTNVAAQYPDHNVMVLAHFFLNGRTMKPAFVDGPGLGNIGPGEEPFLHGFLDLPNLLFCVGGHDRFLRKGHCLLTAKDGHSIDVIGFNTQSAAPRVSQYINLFTFRPKLGTVTISTYDYIENRFLTNNDAALLNNAGQGQEHNWQVPIAIP
jgi:hypothetical protein